MSFRLSPPHTPARGTDRVCSFGDFVAVSGDVDMALARMPQREVSDGIIAPRYEGGALSLLSKKKHGAICRSGDGSGFERWKTLFEKTPERLTKEQKQQWLEKFSPAVLGSDGYIPFRDSIDRAVRSGVRCVVQPGGSTRDAEIIAACGEYGIAMAFSSLRLFHH